MRSVDPKAVLIYVHNKKEENAHINKAHHYQGFDRSQTVGIIQNLETNETPFLMPQSKKNPLTESQILQRS